MSVTVKYFASLRETIGRSEDNFEIDGATLTVADLWGKVTGNRKSMPENVLSAINMEYVKPDTVVKDGDEVAFFPPVTGG